MTLPSASRKYRLHMGSGYYSGGEEFRQNENTPMGAGAGGDAGTSRGGGGLLPALVLRGEADGRHPGAARQGLRPRGQSAPLEPVELLEPEGPADGRLVRRPAV